jgi:hypothetical protein
MHIDDRTHHPKIVLGWVISKGYSSEKTPKAQGEQKTWGTTFLGGCLKLRKRNILHKNDVLEFARSSYCSVIFTFSFSHKPCVMSGRLDPHIAAQSPAPFRFPSIGCENYRRMIFVCWS